MKRYEKVEFSRSHVRWDFDRKGRISIIRDFSILDDEFSDVHTCMLAHGSSMTLKGTNCDQQCFLAWVRRESMDFPRDTETEWIDRRDEQNVELC